MITLTQITPQPRAPLWASLKSYLGIKPESPLLSHHFLLAEHYFNQQLVEAQHRLSSRQLIEKITDLLVQNNRHQAISHFIFEQFGHHTLSLLTPVQLKIVLAQLTHHATSDLQPSTHPANGRPLSIRQHRDLMRQITQLSRITGENIQQIKQSIIDIFGEKRQPSISTTNYPLLITWLQARSTISKHDSLTLHRLHTTLHQTINPQEWQEITHYCHQHFNTEHATQLTQAQAQDVLSFWVKKRLRDAQHNVLDANTISPIFNPLVASIITPVTRLSSTSIVVLLVLVVAISLVIIVI